MGRVSTSWKGFSEFRMDHWWKFYSRRSHCLLMADQKSRVLDQYVGVKVELGLENIAMQQLLSCLYVANFALTSVTSRVQPAANFCTIGVHLIYKYSAGANSSVGSPDHFWLCTIPFVLEYPIQPDHSKSGGAALK